MKEANYKSYQVFKVLWKKGMLTVQLTTQIIRKTNSVLRKTDNLKTTAMNGSRRSKQSNTNRNFWSKSRPIFAQILGFSSDIDLVLKKLPNEKKINERGRFWFLGKLLKAFTPN
jgi:hypothetical protein